MIRISSTAVHLGVRAATVRNGFGFDLIEDDSLQVRQSACHAWGVVIPYWAFCALFLLTPAYFGFTVTKARRRKRAGRCVNCGYDIHVTPDRCPECGWSAGAAG